jgi:GGDEF domain-containing protein
MPGAVRAPSASVSARDAAVTREPQESPVASENGSGHDDHPFDRVFPRETFDVASTAELKRCRRFERSFSLLLLDLGKEADAQAGRILLSSLREFDLVGRYGDRVLAVGLPETAGENARVIAQRLVGLLAERGAWSEIGRYGIATYPKDGNTLTTVVRTARSQLGAADSS